MSTSKNTKVTTIANVTRIHGVGPDRPFLTDEAVASYVKTANSDLFETVTDFVESLGGNPSCVSRLQTDGLSASFLSMITSRGDEGPGRVTNRVFMRGYDPVTVANNLLRNTSATARSIEEPWVQKLGDQGNCFSPVFTFKTVVEKYLFSPHQDPIPFFRDLNQFMEYGVEPSDTFNLYACKAFKKVASEWRARLGKLVRLTEAQTIDEVCSKDTACVPLGGRKNEPQCREYLQGKVDTPIDCDNFYEWCLRTRPLVLVGQRYQRNKHLSDGTPRTRGIFNCDVLSQARCHRWMSPLTKALQENAKGDKKSPVCELNGPDAVGESVANFVMSRNKLTAFCSVGADTRMMDTCLKYPHMYAFVRYVVAPAFDVPENTPEWETLMADFVRFYTPTLVLQGGVTINCGGTTDGQPQVSTLSGITPTHIPESFWSNVISRTIATTTLASDGESVTKRKLYTDGMQELVAGDDIAILTHLPPAFFRGAQKEVYHPATFEPLGYGLAEHIVRLMRIMGFDAAVEKQTFHENVVEFCSHYYTQKAKDFVEECEPGSDVKMVRVTKFWPLYPAIAALNALMNPEDGLADRTLSAEIQRAAMILDSTYGSEMCNALYTTVCNSISPEAKAHIAQLFVAGLDSFPTKRELFYAWATWDQDWNASDSPFIRHLYAYVTGQKIDMSDEERDALRDARLMRAIHWRFRIDPELVALGPTAIDEDLAGDTLDRYLSLFEDERGSDVNHLLKLLRMDPLGRIDQVLRSSASYDHSRGFRHNFPLDTPITVSGEGAASGGGKPAVNTTGDDEYL